MGILKHAEPISLRHFLLFCLFLLGLIFALFPINQGYHYWDETVYLQHGEIISGESPNNFNEFKIRPPLFSILLGVIFLFDHSLIAAHVFVAFSSALGIFLTYWISEELFDAQVGLGAALIYGFSPIRVSMAGDIMVDAILPVLWLLTFISFYKALNVSDSRVKNVLYFLTGVSASLSVLMKFTSLVIILILVVSKILLKFSRDYKNIWKLFLELVEDRNNYIAVSGFIITILPYLVWNKMHFGGFFSTFVYAWMDRGLKDHFLTYLLNLEILILPVFFSGILFYMVNKDNILNFHAFLPAFISGFFYLVMQILIKNREPRFLLPIVPFMAIMASKGFKDILADKKFYFIIIISVIIFLPGVFEDVEKNPFDQGLTYSSPNTPVAEAALWVRENSADQSVLYTNFQEPQLGYYSEREVRWIPEYKKLGQLLGEYISESGYVYYSNNTRFPHPSYNELKNHSDFRHVKSFNRVSHLFYYNRSN